MNAEGYDVTRPINDWCADCEHPVGYAARLRRRHDELRPAVGRELGRLGPVLHPDVLAARRPERLDRRDVQPGPDHGLRRSRSRGTAHAAGPARPRTRRSAGSGARRHQYITVWSTLLFDTDNRVELMDDQLEIYNRGVDDAARPPLSSFPQHPTDVTRQFRNPENYWMIEYPKAYVIPIGDDQRSDPEATAARPLAARQRHRGARSSRRATQYVGPTMRFEQDSWVVYRWTSLSADSPYTVPGRRAGRLRPHRRPLRPSGRMEPRRALGRRRRRDPRRRKVQAEDRAGPEGLERTGRSRRLAKRGRLLARDRLADGGSHAERAARRRHHRRAGDRAVHGRLRRPECLPGRSCSRRAARARSRMPADESGVGSSASEGTLPQASRSTGRRGSPSSTGGLTQELWVLRNLGFTADPVSTATINSAPTDPLLNYDVIFNQGTYPADTPANTTVRAALTSFFAGGGGYIGAGTDGAQLPHRRRQVTGLTRGVSNAAASRLERNHQLGQHRPRHGSDHRRVPGAGPGNRRPAGVAHGGPGRLDDRRQPPADGLLPLRALEGRRGCAVRVGAGSGGDRARAEHRRDRAARPRSR